MPLLSKKTSEVEEKKKEGALGGIKAFVYALAIALVFRSLLFEPFHIPSGSMRPTLLVGDFLFVSKYSYGYSRYSFPYGTKFNWTGEGRIMQSMPERGDVIVFRNPKNPHIDFIKRVIGLPGDRIQMRNGRVMFNGEMLEYERMNDFVFNERPIITYNETLPNGAVHPVLELTDTSEVDFTGEYLVPEGHVFVMGDNRDDSTDSRYLDDPGYIPVDHIVGKAELILLSYKVGSDIAFWEFWRYPELFRSDRFFLSIK